MSTSVSAEMLNILRLTKLFRYPTIPPILNFVFVEKLSLLSVILELRIMMLLSSAFWVMSAATIPIFTV